MYGTGGPSRNRSKEIIVESTYEDAAGLSVDVELGTISGVEAAHSLRWRVLVLARAGREWNPYV